MALAIKVERLVICMAGWEDIKETLFAAGRDVSQKAKEVYKKRKSSRGNHSLILAQITNIVNSFTKIRKPY